MKPVLAFEADERVFLEGRCFRFGQVPQGVPLQIVRIDTEIHTARVARCGPARARQEQERPRLRVEPGARYAGGARGVPAQSMCGSLHPGGTKRKGKNRDARPGGPYS